MTYTSSFSGGRSILLRLWHGLENVYFASACVALGLAITINMLLAAELSRTAYAR